MVTQPLHVKMIAYLIIMTPIMTGFFVPAKILDAAIADKKVVPLFSPSKINQLK